MNRLETWTTRTIAGFTLAVAILLSGLQFTATAGAAPILDPVEDSVAVGCQLLRNEANALIREYGTASTARRQVILGRLSQIGQQWNWIGCRARYGDVTASGVAPPAEPCLSIASCAPPRGHGSAIDPDVGGPSAADAPTGATAEPSQPGDTPADAGPGASDVVPAQPVPATPAPELPPSDPAPGAEEPAVLHVTTSYTAEEHARLVAAAEFWGIPQEEFQKFGVQALRFIHGLSGTTGSDPLRPRPAIDGAVSYTSQWTTVDRAALDWVSGYYDLGHAETQKLGSAVLIFFAALAG